LGRFKISKGRAIDLQKWALKQSEAERFLDSLPKITKAGNAKPGLYVDYKIDENELDDSLDWPDVGIAAVYAVLEYSKEKIHLGEIRAYNFETFWLSTQEYDEVDTAENWFRLIKDDYKKLAKSGREDKEAKQINKESPRLVHDLMSFKLTGEEAEAIYRIIKEYEKNAPESDRGYYDTYFNEYETPIKKKIINSITKKIISFFHEKQKVMIDKDFLRKKYHTFNNEIDNKVYSVIEKAFSQLKTVDKRRFEDCPICRRFGIPKQRF